MDDNQLDLSDWEEPASQPDLSTNDSTFVPPAEEESDEEEPEVEMRQKRSERKCCYEFVIYTSLIIISHTSCLHIDICLDFCRGSEDLIICTDDDDEDLC